ncbi:MAG: hypothetical protein AAF229_12425 [Pseudomonadota bacterium]
MKNSEARGRLGSCVVFGIAGLAAALMFPALAVAEESEPLIVSAALDRESMVLTATVENRTNSDITTFRTRAGFGWLDVSVNSTNFSRLPSVWRPGRSHGNVTLPAGDVTELTIDLRSRFPELGEVASDQCMFVIWQYMIVGIEVAGLPGERVVTKHGVFQVDPSTCTGPWSVDEDTDFSDEPDERSIEEVF